MSQTTVMMINIICLILSLSSHPSASAGFRLKLIHRDSPLSPLHQPNLTNLERFLKNANISEARASYLEQQVSEESSRASEKVSIRIPARFEEPLFTVEIGIGTPAVKRTLIFDTGSSLTWTQCKPCLKCFRQKESLFDTKKSSSYKTMGRKHPLAGGFRCTIFGCTYYLGYYSGQFSAGKAAVENFTFESNNLSTPAVIPSLVFGCGTASVGSFPPQISGILGMDKDPLSFARQLGTAINRRFSYCITPVISKVPTSYVRFGDEAVIRGKNGKKTPFSIADKASAMLYALNLTDLSMNGRKLGLGNGAFPKGCFIDSGASISLLNKRAYAAVKDFVVNQFSKSRDVQRYVGIKVPRNFLCYTYNKAVVGLDSFPSLTFHFQGADYHVPPSNLFFFIQENLFCLAVLESTDTSILGAFQQRNMRIVYDLKERMLSFAPENCSRDI